MGALGEGDAMAYCEQCGSDMGFDAEVCPSCGAPARRAADAPIGEGAAVGSDTSAFLDQEAARTAADGAEAVAPLEVPDSPVSHARDFNNGIAPGFSTHIDTPEFQAAMGSANKTFTLTVAAVALLLAPLLTFIASLISPNNIGVLVGACVIVEIIVIAIVVRMLLKRFAGKSWDGEVVGQHIARETSGNRHTTRRVYVTEFVTSAGDKKKHKERTLHPMYDYLEVGDKVRYHPQLTYPFEKFDKSADESIPCPFCGMLQPIEHDTCETCKKPLLK